MSTLLEKFTQELAERVRHERQPSMSAAAAVDGEIVWTSAHGDANPLAARAVAPDADTRYRIASITKPQVAVAVLALVEDGALDLGTPMGKYLPDAPAGGATVAQFLSHTSGLVAEVEGPWWERAGGCSWDDLVAMDLRQVSPPGLAHHYSNVGYAVLGRLLEVTHGQPWDEVLADVLWKPLGMTQTARTAGDHHATGVAVHPLQRLVHAEPVRPYLALGPAGELWSTPTDLARLGAFLAGMGEGQGVLRPETLALMRHPAALASGSGEPWTAGYGLGLMLENLGGTLRVFHNGSVPGFTAQLSLDPRTGAAVALCGNSTTRHAGALGWLGELSEALPDRGHQSVDARALPAAWRALAGLWYRGPQPMLVKVHADEIEIHPTGAPESVSRVRLSADGRLVGTSEDLAFGEELVVDPGHTGDPSWFTLAGLHHARTPYDPGSEVPGGVDDHGWRPLR